MPLHFMHIVTLDIDIEIERDKEIDREIDREIEREECREERGAKHAAGRRCPSVFLLTQKFLNKFSKISCQTPKSLL